MHRPWLVSGKWSRAPASIKKLMAGDVGKKREDAATRSNNRHCPQAGRLLRQPVISCRGHCTRLQVLVVSDVTSCILLNNGVELGLSDVLDLPLSSPPLLLRHHGFLERQVTPGDLMEGRRSECF